MKDSVDKSKLSKEVLHILRMKSWMTHDAMWLSHCIQEIGIKRANKINIRATESAALIEIKRIRKLLNYDDKPIATFNLLRVLLINSFNLIELDFTGFQYNFPKKNVLAWEWPENKCFAFKGLSSMGYIDEYVCGLIKHIEGWIKGLNIKYKIEPQVNNCLMKDYGKCRGNFIFYL